MITYLITGGIVVAAIIVFLILCKIFYKVANVDKALIITGGKKPVIKVSGGAFVIPIFRKAQYFDLCLLTVPTDGDEIKTVTQVPIVVDWTAQIAPNVDDLEALGRCVVLFKERGPSGIIDDVKLTLMGSVRATVANLTPEQVQNDKESFKNDIIKSVEDELTAMGLKLISLNIQDITDNNGYYNNIAMIDMEDKRLNAERKSAQVDQDIRTQKAESEKVASQNELDSELAIAEKNRDNDLKKAAFKAETDKANADAAVAGELQRTIRLQEVAEQEGKVAIIRREQENLAAIKEKDVIKTRAESEKVAAEIKAQEVAAVNTIDAEAKARIAEVDAKGKAIALEREAEGKAKAVKTEAEAEANKTRLIGETEADVISKKGIAEADAIRAKKLAEAEGERAMAEARAGNDKVNFEIEKIKLETQARIEIATKTATIMAELGKNAQFIDLGGSGGVSKTGNVLTDTLSAIPALMKSMNVQNEALNGTPYSDTVRELIDSVAGPVKGILSTANSTTNNYIESDSSTSADDSDTSK